jgi:hypothetical protein
VTCDGDYQYHAMTPVGQVTDAEHFLKAGGGGVRKLVEIIADMGMREKTTRLESQDCLEDSSRAQN